MPIRVTIWNEFRHEKTNPKVTEIYPHGMHEVIAAHLRKSPNLEVTTATLDDPEHGLTDQRVNETDVLVWWGHLAHDELQDLIVQRLYLRALLARWSGGCALARVAQCATAFQAG